MFLWLGQGKQPIVMGIVRVATLWCTIDYEDTKARFSALRRQTLR